MPTRTSSKAMARFEEALQTEVSLGQASAEFPTEWLLFTVTRLNDREEPTHGNLLYHHKRDRLVLSKLTDLALSGDCAAGPGAKISRFYGVKVVWPFERPSIVLFQLSSEPRTQVRGRSTYQDASASRATRHGCRTGSVPLATAGFPPPRE